MAVIYPDWTTIKKAHQPPTDGEIIFLEFLENTLSNEYEIYFQPYLNGDRPDIILMRKGGGVLIIEVKDFDLSLYRVNDSTNWEVRKPGNIWQQIRSPFSQVYGYKKNLFDLHSKELLAGKMNDSRTFYVVNCAVFFSKATLQQFKSIAINPFKDNEDHEQYLRFIKYVEVYTLDTLQPEILEKHLEKIWLSRKSILFVDKYYNSMKRYLQPPYHYEEEGIEIRYTSEQYKLLESVSGKRQKIKGVAGCGKTFVLAKRAVNAHLRTGEPVLVLTYNLSLVNYIRDRISSVRANFAWENFHIINYHQFFKGEARNYGLEIESFASWDNPNFFAPVKNQIKTYSAIFIDEVQDYKTQWLDLISSYFLRLDGEFVVFGDEKQNIYDRPLDDEKNIITKGIRGDWNRSLKTSIRFTENIAKLAARFQQHFLGVKYNLEQMRYINQLEFGFSNVVGKLSRIDYFNMDDSASALEYFNTIRTYTTKYSIHPSDIGILGATIDLLREIDFHFRNEGNEKTTVMFENHEYFTMEPRTKEDLEQKRRAKKMHFYMKTGTMKLSTIHSFKGWDIPTLFLLIDDDELDGNSFTTEELIYTAITRAKQNLIILNTSHNKYHEFFLKENNGNVTVA